MTDEEIDAEAHAPIIRDRAEQLCNEVHEADFLNDTKFDCWGARAILRLAELEADRPAEDAPDHEHDAYAHERAATMASIASELLSAVAHSDVVNDVETGQLLVASSATHEPVSDHHHTAHWSVRRHVESDDSLSLCRVRLRRTERGTAAPAGLGRDPDLRVSQLWRRRRDRVLV